LKSDRRLLSKPKSRKVVKSLKKKLVLRVVPKTLKVISAEETKVGKASLLGKERIQKLIGLGRSQGFVTSDDILKTFPEAEEDIEDSRYQLALEKLRMVKNKFPRLC